VSPLRFHFDYLSPYAYLVWTRLPGIAARHGRPVEIVPVLLAGLLGAHGQKGPAEIPAKRLYTFKDTLRKAAAWGVVLSPPASLPFNPLVPLRVSSLELAPDARTRLVDALWRATWAEGRDVSDAGVVAAIADGVGLDGRALIAEAATDAAKARLRAQTDAAIAGGVFGVPTVVVDGEPFWGTDALPHLERFLEGRDPVGPGELARFEAIRPSAMRPAGR